MSEVEQQLREEIAELRQEVNDLREAIAIISDHFTTSKGRTN